MKKEIKIPAMGESVNEAIVSNILKPTGSYVKADEEILELETDKVNQVLYAPAAGAVTFTVSAGQTVKIGDVIGYVDTDAKGEAAQAPSAPKAEAPKAAAAPAPAPKASPEGPSSRIMAQDFVNELKTPAPAPASTPSFTPAPAPRIVTEEGVATRKKMSNLRKVIAQRLVEAKNTTAMLTTFNEIDMTQIMEIRAREKDSFTARYGVKLGFMSFFIKAVVHALKAIPQVNAMIDGDEIVTFQTYDIGVAVSSEKGLMVPVIRGCDKLSFGGVEKNLEEFAKKARSGTISVDDLRGGSFTVTNGGVFGSLLSTPILNPPQSAILGMHTIVKRPVVVNDQIVIRPMMYVALSYDHRIIDGREAVLFLVQLKQTLEDPARLLLEL
ncbi:MAG: dihydrolipoyllysine-residue succinyltransferase [Chlamydiales bacterium]|nr:dihydrolipoyllysine-residue succinyltransferase [Chlamydiales bacterium]